MFFSKRILQLCSVIRFRDKAIIGRLLLYYCRPPVDDPWIWLFHFMNYNIYPLFYRKTKASVEIIQYFFIFTSFISLMPPPLSCNLLLSFHFFFLFSSHFLIQSFWIPFPCWPHAGLINPIRALNAEVCVWNVVPEAWFFLPCVSAIIWSALELHQPAGFTQHHNWPPCTGNFHMCKQQAHMCTVQKHMQAHWSRWQYVQVYCVRIKPERVWAAVCLMCMRQNSPRSSRLIWTDDSVPAGMVVTCWDLQTMRPVSWILRISGLSLL